MARKWFDYLLGENHNRQTVCNPCYMKDYRKKTMTSEKKKEARDRSSAWIREKRLTPEFKTWEHERRHTLNNRFSVGKRRARKIKKPWLLTKEEYGQLILQPCHYCSNKLDTPVRMGVGLDRLDNSLGYTLENVVSCCELCNCVRGDKLSSEEMKVIALTLIKLRKNDLPPLLF